jgi:hypothetical protein
MNNASKWFISLLFLPLSSVYGQVFETPEWDANPLMGNFHKSIKAEYAFNAVSKHFNYSFSRDFYTGQFLDEPLILQNENRLDPNKLNHLGFETQGGISFLMTPKTVSPTKVRQAYASLGQQSVLGSMYTSDAWKLLMRGNGPYVGQAMDLAKNGFRNMQWFELSYGERTKNLSKNNMMQWGVNALMLRRYQYVFIQDGHLITDNEGEYVDVLAKGSREQQHSPGIGLTGNFSYSKGMGTKQVMQWYVKDVGVSFLGNNRYEVDTSFRFSGFYVADPLTWVSGDQWQNKTDSLIEGLTGRKTKAKPVVMPAKTGIFYLFNLNKNHGLSIDLSYRFFSFAMPQCLLAHHVLIRDALSVKSTIGYGGWGGIQWNESLAFHGKKASLLIEFGGMQSMISDKMPFQFSGRTGFFIRI